MPAKMLRAAAGLYCLVLVTAAPVYARGWRERLIPPLPIPHVAHIVHQTKVIAPLPRPRPDLTATSPAPAAPKKTLVPIND